MIDPVVCAIMLTRDRPEMAARAARCFERQTYLRKRMVIGYCQSKDLPHLPANQIIQCIQYLNRQLTIGAIRNMLIKHSTDDWQIAAHFDDDDWSHPNRITEQAALLQSGDYDCVGYNDMLFWDCSPEAGTGQAYYYKHGHADYCIGTSLCYWRRTWERRPFEDLPKPGGGISEDFIFQSVLRRKAVSSISEDSVPRMIATIHGGNSQIDNYRAAMSHQNVFLRVPEWDERVRQALEE